MGGSGGDNRGNGLKRALLILLLARCAGAFLLLASGIWYFCKNGAHFRGCDLSEASG
jgi:hypothetical protein